MSVQVELCDDAAIMPPVSSTAFFAHTQSSKQPTAAQASSNSVVHPKRLLQVQGPAAITGLDPVVFDNAAFEPVVSTH